MGQFIFSTDEGINFDNLSGERDYNEWTFYAQAKLANVLFAKGLQKRAPSVTAVSVHPGAITSTNLGRHNSLSSVWQMLKLFWHKGFAVMKYALWDTTFKSIPQGAAPEVAMALGPVIPGKYYTDTCQIEDVFLHPLANDEAAADRLWLVSEEMIAQKIGRRK